MGSLLELELDLDVAGGGTESPVLAPRWSAFAVAFTSESRCLFDFFFFFTFPVASSAPSSSLCRFDFFVLL